MNLAAALVACFALAAPMPHVNADEPKREPKPRFKGVEVYSWKDEKGGDDKAAWNYAILDGTNRNKTEQEVKRAKTVYTGTDSFIDALKLLAEGESVFWFHQIDGFEFPPKDQLKKIDEAAKAAKIELARGK